MQFIFYRQLTRPTGTSQDDVLVKVLLNENEATLPIKTDRAPYYHWKDMRAYMERLLGKKIE